MNAKTVCLFFLTVLIFFVCGYLFIDLTPQRNNAVVLLVVAKHNYPEGTAITDPEQMFELREISESDAPLSYIVDLEKLRNTTLTSDIRAGEPVAKHFLLETRKLTNRLKLDPHGEKNSLPAGEEDDLAKAKMKLLAGEWESVSRVTDGEKIPDAEEGKPRVMIRGHRYTVRVGDRDMGTGSFVLDPRKGPIAIDMSPDGEKVKYLGIIEISEGEHKMCWAEEGKPRPTKFTAEKGSGQTLAIYRRIR
jgi:uncharacterized protein (TIGR03067 family)